MIIIIREVKNIVEAFIIASFNFIIMVLNYLIVTINFTWIVWISL